MMYASVHFMAFSHEVNPFLKLISNSLSFHKEIITMTMSGYLTSDKMFTRRGFMNCIIVLQNGYKLNKVL
jgi:hypothetical protein